MWTTELPENIASLLAEALQYSFGRRGWTEESGIIHVWLFIPIPYRTPQHKQVISEISTTFFTLFTLASPQYYLNKFRLLCAET